mgnify:CR=1 FL=1
MQTLCPLITRTAGVVTQIDILPANVLSQSTRGFDIEADNVSESEKNDVRDFATDYLDIENNLREGKRWGRLYGGSLVLMGLVLTEIFEVKIASLMATSAVPWLRRTAP